MINSLLFTNFHFVISCNCSSRVIGGERQQRFKMRSLHKDENIEAIDDSSSESSEDEAPKQKKTKVVKF